ncbi:protein NTM1-like 9 isoform X2 [Syzygium oleosum]|uniref:protein NTM1-like 9 isoform X2 n=1 Tax=Syzygium oleosum TaxID=219896 RepID=UPI0024B9C7A9|nr:protein NTM1-like 9 isoform X2 [Syzygium oleosum]
MATWPVGLRFRPTEDELVDHHLRGKLKGKIEPCCLIPELYIYKCEPPDLFNSYNKKSAIPSDGRECFFFSPCGDNIPNNRRSNNRMTEFGYWKDTCKKRVIRSLDTGKQIGIRKNLVFYEGRQPKGRKTDVVMHEYHLNSSVSDSKISGPMAFVLCHIFDRKRKKARSAKASEEVTIETENENEISISSMPDCNVPVIPQQAQMHEEQSLLHNGHPFIDGHIDEFYDEPYSLSNNIEILDLWNVPTDGLVCQSIFHI